MKKNKKHIICPVTGNVPTRMTEVGFVAACNAARKKAERDPGDRLWEKRDLPACSECKGSTMPPHLEIISLDTIKNDVKKEEVVVMNSIKKIKCEICGELKKKLVPCHGQQACTMCQNMMANIRKRPEVVVQMLWNEHGDKYNGRGPVDTAILDRIQEELNRYTSLIKNIVEELDSPLGDDGIDNIPQLVGKLKALAAESLTVPDTGDYDAVVERMTNNWAALVEISDNLNLEPWVDPAMVPGMIRKIRDDYETKKKMLYKLDKLYLEQDEEMRLLREQLYDLRQFGTGTIELTDNQVDLDINLDTIHGYEALTAVLMAAIDQAAIGKGKKRHAVDNVPFHQQKSCNITRSVGLGYPIGQAIKKAEESLILGERGPAELLGAINYLAIAHIVMREKIVSSCQSAVGSSEFTEVAA